MNAFRRVLELTPADSSLRTTYGIWLADLGYLEPALAQLEIATTSDPLSYEANLFRARVLDTLGRHLDAYAAFETAMHLPAGTRKRLAYARWYNAVWRHDYATARECAADMAADEHFRDVYAAATEALIDPARWPQVEPLIAASERTSGRPNFLRLLLPEPDFAKVTSALENVLRTGSSSYHLLIWNPESAALRRDPAFQDFLRRTRIIDYWTTHGWPPQCKPDGDGALCQ